MEHSSGISPRDLREAAVSRKQLGLQSGNSSLSPSQAQEGPAVSCRGHLLPSVNFSSFRW